MAFIEMLSDASLPNLLMEMLMLEILVEGWGVSVWVGSLRIC